MPWIACTVSKLRAIAAENPAARVNKPLSHDLDTNDISFLGCFVYCQSKFSSGAER
jgi:hypothetical protein